MQQAHSQVKWSVNVWAYTTRFLSVESF